MVHRAVSTLTSFAEWSKRSVSRAPLGTAIFVGTLFSACVTDAAAEQVSPAQPPASAAGEAALATPAASDLGRPPTELPQELDEAKSQTDNWLNITKESDPLRSTQEWLDSLKQKSGLTLGAAYTILLQQATGGMGHRTGATGDVDLWAKWDFIGAGTKNVGAVNASTEYRHQIGDIPASALGSEIGTLIPTTNSFSERTFVVKELYYDQRLFEGRFRFGVGRIDPENLVAGHRLQSANTYFLNKAFSGNPAVAFPSIGLGAAGGIQPLDWLYFTGGVFDANASITRTGFDTAFDSGELFSYAEAGVLTENEELGAGRFRLSFWHIDEREDAGRPSDEGVSFTVDQDFGPHCTAFGRIAYSDADVTGVQDLYEAGVALKGIIGSKNDVTGFAAARAESPDDGGESILECFHRFQVALRMQFTVGAQLILEPVRAPDDDALGVFSFRFRVSF